MNFNSLKYLGLHNFKIVLAYSSYSELVYDVTAGPMTLIYFGGKLPTGKRNTGKFCQGIYTLVQNLVT